MFGSELQIGIGYALGYRSANAQARPQAYQREHGDFGPTACVGRPVDRSGGVPVPIWRISPPVTFAVAHFILKNIERVTLRDGLAASLIVAGVFVLSRG